MPGCSSTSGRLGVQHRYVVGDVWYPVGRVAWAVGKVCVWKGAVGGMDAVKGATS